MSGSFPILFRRPSVSVRPDKGTGLIFGGGRCGALGKPILHQGQRHRLRRDFDDRFKNVNSGCDPLADLGMAACIFVANLMIVACPVADCEDFFGK